jgi:DNA-binding CsgD family transcriptional regulator
MRHRTTSFIIWLSLIFLFHLSELYPQSVNIGIPPVLNFDKSDFKAGTQIWDIAQDSNGVMWYANNSGLLEFDGMHWRLYPLDNGTIVRSVGVGPNGNIYVGGQGDFGFFSPDERGRMTYHSLKNQLPAADQHFADVWDIEVCADGVFFRTDHQVFRYAHGTVKAAMPEGSSLFFMGFWKNQLVIQSSTFQLYVFENEQFIPLSHPSVFDKGKISAILQWSTDSILVTTIGDGIFYFKGASFEPWETQDDAFLKNNIIFCSQMLPDGKIAIGTALHGMATLDRFRRIFLQINKKNGLQNNTVLSLLAARNGSVWLGLDNGITWVDIQSPFTTFFPDGELQGTGYTARIYKGKIYFGTNTGLYAIDWKSYYTPAGRSQFHPVAHSNGQVWSLNELDGQLLMGHHDGAFVVNGLNARKIASLMGVWQFLPFSPGWAVAGHYNGFAMLKQSANGWVFDAPLPGFAESSRLLASGAAGNIWMAHPYRGIYRARIRPEEHQLAVDFFDGRQGLPSELGNNLFGLDHKIIFTGKKGVFSFNEATGRFDPDDRFNGIFGENVSVQYLKQDNAGNIWFVTNKETGALMVENKTLDKEVNKVLVPELNTQLTDGFPFILPVDAQNLFVATTKGFIHFNPEIYFRKKREIRIVLQEVRLKSKTDSLLFGGHIAALGSKTALSSDQNTISFAFAAPDCPGGEFVRYAHFLEGSETGWSEWNKESDLRYNNLPPGNYSFHVKARNQYGQESEEVSFHFSISPPWYYSRLAYLFYILLLLGLLLWLIYRQQKKFEAEKALLHNKHQMREAEHLLLAQQSEEEINRLQHEKLAAEVSHKNQELASATLHIVQKNEILNNIASALNKLKQRVSQSPDVEKEVSRIIKILDIDASFDADWEHFFQNFDQVHSDFLKRLAERFSHLSPNDYKMCAYLRMNLSSKEIAALMNISIRGVEAGRYRLRKRLELDTETNLTDFLIRF